MTNLAYVDSQLSGGPHETLTRIFQRVLGRTSVMPEDDFFDLGGDSILAIELMAEIEKAFGQDLPMTTVYDAPTVMTLAQVIAEGARPIASCLILLKAGAQAEPLFIAHGLGGSVMELRQVATAIDTGHPVYGIEARGLDGNAEPFDSIEDMAKFYIEAIRQVQPHGPYLLAGFSFGGLVALEMAQLLVRQNETVQFLALLDTFPHTRYWPMRSRIASWRQLAAFVRSGGAVSRLVDYHRDVIRTKSAGGALFYLASRAWRAAKLSFNIFRLGAWLQRFADLPEAPQSPARTIALPNAVERVQRAGEIAYRKYRPRFYDNEIIFIKAQKEMRIPFDATLLWGKLARKITVQVIATDHQNLVRASAASLAAQLTMNLRASSSRANI